MKTLARISFLLLFFIANVNAQEVDSEVEVLKASNLGVVAVHDLELMPGVDAKEFEAFVLAEIIPIYSNMEGQTAMLAKGDRGIHTGHYALILTFDSIEDRDRIYPPSGGFVGDFGEDAIWEKFEAMAKGIGTTFTDYVTVND